MLTLKLLLKLKLRFVITKILIPQRARAHHSLNTFIHDTRQTFSLHQLALKNGIEAVLEAQVLWYLHREHQCLNLQRNNSCTKKQIKVNKKVVRWINKRQILLI